MGLRSARTDRLADRNYNGGGTFSESCMLHHRPTPAHTPTAALHCAPNSRSEIQTTILESWFKMVELSRRSSAKRRRGMR
ncbi:hypothetical protein AOXY_G28175 [Acipenser oxyrinchus oxyrinchus]|uniref:Uncharacterized protein n=1 Tax=Acipenser oxyrinchus oxyrinchus TaxID=40147 RepID=A0AAD8CN22_ACIOX|nr:hypothetical protein AOXY_G28175 [Acipenser oxyrinchus oxyrinchus]